MIARQPNVSPRPESMSPIPPVLARTSAIAAVLALFALSSPTRAQRPRMLDKPQVELGEPFTNVVSVRELSDGRVVVIDQGDRALYVADFAAGTSTQIGRPGGGPAEYRSPQLLLAGGRDTTLLTDPGNNRILIIGPDAKPAGLLTGAFPMAEGQPGTRLPRAMDASGRGYFLSRAGNLNQTSSTMVRPDSVAIVRTARGSMKDDSLAFVQMAPRKITTTTKDGKLTGVNIVIAPFPAADAWQVFPDGAIAIVRAKGYRVDWVLPDGKHVTGKENPFTPVRVVDADKRPPASGNAARSGGAAGAAPSPPLDLEWPDFKPAFFPSNALAGTDGRIWIQRHVAATDARALYDVADRRGVIVEKVELPKGGRIVGFGAKSIYVVRLDADDLQYLQRYPLH
ncbi:MAG TPA: hypothetical protein VM076_23635 [Gemmatimonadaceae bacterium]|nr:hypothetical protein [Gemmatimonadaceae bacterium]